MKKKILSILPLLLFTVVLVRAQEATTYRGAFAPAPTPMWTDNWTNWDPQNTFYGTPNVNVSGVITANTTWTKNNVYLLQGLVFVDSLVTLTIEAGTVIRGETTPVTGSALIIERGAKIIANGTPCNPIVFTSPNPIGSRVKGDWDGLIILGNAVNNVSNDLAIEGIGTSNVRARHGGTDNADNSGSLKYVRIEYAGFVFGPSNEINSLTMGSVGSGTTIDYVQTSFGNDDAFEWFGGSVNCKHLVAYRTVDDDFDTDNGYSGLVQFALSVKDPAVADLVTNSTSEGFESDNNAGGTAATPKTNAKFYNVTQVGAFRCGSNTGGITQPTADAFRRGLRLRRNTDLKIFNSIFMNNWRGLFLDGTAVLANAAGGTLEFKNNIIAMDTVTSWAAPYTGVAKIGEDVASRNFVGLVANTNTILNTPCDVLVNAWDFLNPDYRPNGVGTGAALVGTDLSVGIQIQSALFVANQSADILVDLIENGVGNSNGTITVTIPSPSGWNITVPSITLTTTPQTGVNGTSAIGGAAYVNGDWLFSKVGSNIIATSKPGITIPQNGFIELGFIATRKSTTSNGTNQNLGANILGGSDTTPENNGALTTLGTN
jgi:hypothetical protein